MLRCLFGQFDQNDVRVLARAVEHDVAAISRDVKRSNGAAIVELCQRPSLAGHSVTMDLPARAGSFQTMPLPAPGPLITLTTSANGDGAVDFEFRALMILAGSTNDVMFRIIDNETAPTSERRSQCMTIAAR